MKKTLAQKKQVEVLDHIATGGVMRRMREEAGLSLKQLGWRMGLTASYLSLLENGKRPWSEERAQRFYRALK